MNFGTEFIDVCTNVNAKYLMKQLPIHHKHDAFEIYFNEIYDYTVDVELKDLN